MSQPAVDPELRYLDSDQIIESLSDFSSFIESESRLNIPRTLFIENQHTIALVDELERGWQEITEKGDSDIPGLLREELESIFSNGSIPKNIQWGILTHFLDPKTSVAEVDDGAIKEAVADALWDRRNDLFDSLRECDPLGEDDVSGLAFIILNEVSSAERREILQNESAEVFRKNLGAVTVCFINAPYWINSPPSFLYLLEECAGQSGYDKVAIFVASLEDDPKRITSIIDRLPRTKKFALLEGLKDIHADIFFGEDTNSELSDAVVKRLTALSRTKNPQTRNLAIRTVEAHLNVMSDEVYAARGESYQAILDRFDGGVSGAREFDKLIKIISASDETKITPTEYAAEQFSLMREGAVVRGTKASRNLLRCLEKASRRSTLPLAKSLISPIQEFFESYGLPESLFGIKHCSLRGSWTLAGSRKARPRTILRHVRTIDKLESEMPGSAELLYNHLKVQAFGRYSVEMLLDQAKTIKSTLNGVTTSQKPIIVAVAADDWDDALSEQPYISALHELGQQYDKSVPILVSDFRSVVELLHTLRRAKRLFGKLHNVVVDWHGGEIDGKKLESLIESDNKRSRFTSYLNKVLADDFSLTLCGCYAAREGGVFDRLLPVIKGRRGEIIAAQNEAYVESVAISKSETGFRPQITFTSNMKKPGQATRRAQLSPFACYDSSIH